MKTQSSTKEWESTKGSIHLETGGMTSKELSHSYSRKKGTFEKSVNQKSECCQEKEISRKKFWENPNRKPVRDFKIRIWTQIEISKLGSGASSSFVGFRELAFDEDK